MPAEDLAVTFERLAQVAATVDCDCSTVHTQYLPAKKGSGAPDQATSHVLVRKQPSQGHHLDLRVAGES
jgi:hypothetical protein